MATSGIYTYSRTLNQLVEEALDILQCVGDGEPLGGDAIDRARPSLNAFIKHYETTGLNMWAETEGTFFLTVGQAAYSLNSDEAANTYYSTQLAAAVSSGASTITVDSIANISNGDIIGIVKSDNDLFWTTVNGAPAGSTVTLTDTIDGAASEDGYVYNYVPSTSTVPALKPVTRITSMRRKDSGGNEIPLRPGSRQDYFDLPNKSQSGTPIMWFYDRGDIAGESGGTVYLWNAPDSSVPVINFTYERKIQTMVNANDTLDFPDHMHLFIQYGLARELIPKFGCSKDIASLVMGRAEQLERDVLAFGASMTPVQFGIPRS